MKIEGQVFIGLVAAGATFITITTDNDQLAIISGLIGAFSWWLFAFYALDIRIFDGTGSEQISRYPAWSAWALMMSIPNLYVALTGPLHIVRDRDQLSREVRQ